MKRRAKYLFAARWPSFACPARHEQSMELDETVDVGMRQCGRQTSVTAGTIMHHSKLPLTTWFWAAYLDGHPLQRHLGPAIATPARLAPDPALGCSVASCASMVAPCRTALAGFVEIDETEFAAVGTIPRPALRPQPPGQDADRRRRRGAGRRGGARPHPPEQAVRLRSRQPASVHRRQPCTRRHCQQA